MDEEQYQAYVKAVLYEQFGLQGTELQRLARQHNNITHLVTLPQHTQNPLNASKPMPGTSAIPPQTDKLVFRMPHSDTSLETPSVIEHEVAMMEMIRPALVLEGRQLVPEVYGWCSGEQKTSWMVEEYRDGLNIHEEFSKMEIGKKRHVLRQMALVVKALQTIDIPESFTGLGGAGFNDQGEIVSKPMPTGVGGPFVSTVALYTESLKAQLQKSDNSDLLQGWRPDGLRSRLEKLLDGGIAKLLGTDTGRAVIHGDISLENMVFDPQDLSLLGLYWYELSHVAAPLSEFFYSFYDVDGILTGPYGESTEQVALRDAILNGFPKELPFSQPKQKAVPQFGEERHVQWKVAQLWDEELERADALRPRTVREADKVSQVHWFLDKVCPFYFLQSRWLASRTEAQLAGDRIGCKMTLEQYLDDWGY